jgi:hypothetical protein
VTLEIELGRRPRSTCSEMRVHFRILRARDDRVGESRRCRRITWRQAFVDTVMQPVTNSADRERTNRHARGGGFEPDESEWLGPKARQDEEIGIGEKAADTIAIEPACEVDPEARLAFIQFTRGRLPECGRGSVPD